MSRTREKTVELVGKAIVELEARGESITVRKVRAITGRGSANTIAELLRDRRNEPAIIHAPVAVQSSIVVSEPNGERLRLVELERQNAALVERVAALAAANATFEKTNATLGDRLAQQSKFYEDQLTLAHERFRGLEVRTLMQLEEERVLRRSAEERLRHFEGRDDFLLKESILRRKLGDTESALADANGQIYELEQQVEKMRGSGKEVPPSFPESV